MVHVLPQQLNGRLRPVGLELRHVEVVDEDDGLLPGRRPEDTLATTVQLGVNEVLNGGEGAWVQVRGCTRGDDMDKGSDQRCADLWSILAWI